MAKKIAVFPGDGIGGEVVSAGVKILEKVNDKYSLGVEMECALVGGSAYDAHGAPLPEPTLKLAKEADAILLGAVGGPKWEPLAYEHRPERALLGLRGELDLYANLRPAKVYPALVGSSSLKREIIEGTDIMVVRELTGGIYFGEPKGVEDLPDGSRRGFNTLVYTTPEIERIAKIAFEVAQVRGKKVCSVDKANVLECTELWRQVVTDLHEGYEDIELSHMYVDNCAMQLVRWPKQFDVIVTTNMFGDILSDEAAQLTGSIGMLPSASLNEQKAGMYEPVHGSAPDITGKDKANPSATILSVAMMLRYTFDEHEAADDIEQAVEKTLENGYRTADIFTEGDTLVGCVAMGEKIAEAIG